MKSYKTLLGQAQKVISLQERIEMASGKIIKLCNEELEVAEKIIKIDDSIIKTLKKTIDLQQAEKKILLESYKQSVKNIWTSPLVWIIVVAVGVILAYGRFA